jgi:serine/threonine protein kinase/WD40 repeat protein/Flp pilus assembly protein TadD
MADPVVNRHLLLDELANEFAARYRHGERPALTEYIDKYPDLADEIREFFPAMIEIEVVKAAADGPATIDDIILPKIEHLGDFHILREIGHGGMGVVYEAEQISLGRRVALKLLTQRMLRDAVQKRRFEREAKAAARLHHTNIVPVFGSGEHDGTPYYVMQFIQGLGLDVVTEEVSRLQGGHTAQVNRRDVSEVANSLMTGEFNSTGDFDHRSGSGQRAVNTSGITVSMTQPGSTATGSGSDRHQRKLSYWQGVARIGVQVADALEYAHRQGIIHRDVKPSNLLLDLSGTAWITDFGLAKGDDQENLTRTGDMLGTLRYMPPEAFDGKCDARGDVYGLGITLYEMLGLRPAYDQHDRNRLIKAVTTSEPPRLRSVRFSVPRDLETIVHKAIDREPNRRYRTAAELGADLQRFLNDEPIKAREISVIERTWRWCRRYPFDAAMVAAFMLAFLAGFAGVAWQWRVAERREKEAVAARDDANQTRNAAARQAAALLLDRGIEDARSGEPARALHVLVQALRALPANDAASAPLDRVIRMNLAAWAENAPALEHIFPRGPRFDYVAFSPDGEQIAMAVGRDGVQCFRTETGRPVGPQIKLPICSGSAMEFAADGHSLWVASPGAEKVVDRYTVHRLDPSSGRPIQPPLSSPGPVHHTLTATPDGRYLIGRVLALHPNDAGPKANAFGSRLWRTASILVWETATGQVVRKLDVNAESDSGTSLETPDSHVCLSADGKSVIAWVQRGSDQFEGITFTVNGDEPPNRRELPPIGKIASWKLHFDNNMSTALVIKDGQLHRLSATNPGLLGPAVPTPFRLMLYGSAADGRSLISETDGRLFDTGAWPPRASGVRFAHPGWQPSADGLLKQSMDGRFAATWLWGHADSGRLWRHPRPHSRPALSTTESVRLPQSMNLNRYAQFDPRGNTAILWSHRLAHWVQGTNEIHNVRVVDVTTGAIRETCLRHSELIREVALAPDGRHFATASFDGTARVWETATGRPAGPPLPHTNYVATVAFSPEGDTLAAGDYGPAGLIKLWDWRTGKELRPALQHDDIVVSVTFSPDGQYLAAIKAPDWSKNPEILVWEISSGTAVIRMRHAVPSYTIREPVRFRPDGRAITTRDANGLLRLWDLPSGKPLGEPRPLDGHGVTRFSPDGRMVAAAAKLGVRLLDGNTLTPLPAGYLPHPDPINDVAFSPDGAFLLTAHETGSAQLWDVATRKPIGPPAVLIGPIRAVAFAPDGKTCLCVANDGTVRRWSVPAPIVEPDLGHLSDRVVLMTGQRMDDNQGLDTVAAEEWRALRVTLVGDGSTALVPPRPDADWHDAVAADAEQDADSFGAEWHLERLAKLRPNDWTISARRGRVLARADRMDEAAAAYDQAARLAPSPRDLADWLRAAATDDEAANRYDQGLWNLDRAEKLTPEDWVPYAARAVLADLAGSSERTNEDIDSAIRLGAESTAITQMADRVAARAVRPSEWARVQKLLTLAAKDPRISLDDRYHLAVACIRAGDHPGYRAACAAIAERMPKPRNPMTVDEAITASKAFALGPRATDDWSLPISWADRVLTRLAELDAADPSQKDEFKPLRFAFTSRRVALLYRAGQYDEAVKALRKAMTFHADGGDFHNWIFLALAEHQLGHAEAAKESAAKARALAKPSTAWEKAELELLTAELDAVMPSPGK